MRCWTWTGPVDLTCVGQVPPGLHTCEAHRTEEVGLQEVLNRLKTLRTDLKGLALMQHAHPDSFKDLAEDPARTFFRTSVQEAIVAVGYSEGDRRQRDIVVADPSAGSVLHGGRVLVSDDRAEKYGHLEVKYSARGRLGDLKAMLLEDIARLHQTLELAAREAWPFKPWTGCVLLGPAWSNHFPMLLHTIHDHYHDQVLTPVQSEKGKWWPVIDSIVMPGFWLKLHEIFEQPSESSPHRPAFGMYLAADDDPEHDLRPLALAAALLRHSVRFRKGLAGKGEALAPGEYSAAAGPRGGFPRNMQSNRQIVFVALEHPAPTMYQVVGSSVSLQLTRDDDLWCSGGQPFLYGVEPEEETRLATALSGKDLSDV